MATINKEPWERLTNLKEVIENKIFRSEVGWVDNKHYFRGRFYTPQEIEEMFPIKLKYSTVRLDSKQLEP